MDFEDEVKSLQKIQSTIEEKTPKKLKTKEIRASYNTLRKHHNLTVGVKNLKDVIEILKKSAVSSFALLEMLEECNITLILKQLYKKYFPKILHIKKRITARNELLIKSDLFLSRCDESLIKIPLRSIIRIIRSKDINLLVWYTSKLGILALEFIAFLF